MESGRARCTFGRLLLAAASALFCTCANSDEAPDVRARVDALRRLIARDDALARQLDDRRLRAWAADDPNGVSSVTLPRSGAAPLDARLGGLGLRLTPVGARANVPLETAGVWAVYTEQFPSTDGFVVTGAGFLEALWLLRDEAAPTRFAWDIGAPWLKALRPDADGGASLLTATGDVALRVRPPLAIDAEGRRVDCALHVEGTRLTVLLTGAPRAFPVVVDPVVETVGWNEQPFLGTRSSHAMAALNGDVVLFGGNDGQSLRDDTWVWDGTRWTRQNPADSPPARNGHAMAALNGKLVLFGGSRMGAPLLGDTWTWDGTTWTKQTPAVSPPARASAVMATLNDTVVLFGGFGENSVPLNDTWAWDGTTWTQRTPAHAPEPRESAAMATAAGEVVLFGGYSNGAYVSDTWTWDGQDWTRRTPATTPPGRGDHAMASLNGVALLQGGRDATARLGDLWTWDGSNWTLSSAAGGPGGVAFHAMAERGGKVVLYGGTFYQSSAVSGLYPTDTWEWSGTAWAKKAPNDRPAAREQTAMATLHGKVVLFGGVVNATLQSDTWTWDGTSWVKQTPATSPPARYRHAMATLGETVVLFGGGQGTSRLADTWTWDGTTWTKQTPATSPPAREEHAMATLNGKVLLFGGLAAGGFVDDTWTWDGTTWTRLTPATSPPARVAHAMATVGGAIVLFGGTNNAVFSDTWTWDGATWTQLTPPVSPPGRYWTSMVGLEGKAVLFSGNTQASPRADTWEWDGSTWDMKTLASSPATRNSGAMAALDETRAVLFGGWNGTFGQLSDTWHYVSDARLSNGKPCVGAAECVSGFCADGVCCDSACGGGVPGDCQACAVTAGATVDGVCAPRPASAECRPSNGVCDVAETCSGDSPDCPADAFAPPTRQCRPAACRGDDAVAGAWCTGSVADCPDEVVSRCEPGLCAEGLCDTPDAGAPDGGTSNDAGSPTDADAAHRYAIGCVSPPGVTLWPWLLVLLPRPRRRRR